MLTIANRMLRPLGWEIVPTLRASEWATFAAPYLGPKSIVIRLHRAGIEGDIDPYRGAQIIEATATTLPAGGHIVFDAPIHDGPPLMRIGMMRVYNVPELHEMISAAGLTFVAERRLKRWYIGAVTSA